MDKSTAGRVKLDAVAEARQALHWLMGHAYTSDALRSHLRRIDERVATADREARERIAEYQTVAKSLDELWLATQRDLDAARERIDLLERAVRAGAGATRTALRCRDTWARRARDNKRNLDSAKRERESWRCQAHLSELRRDEAVGLLRSIGQCTDPHSQEAWTADRDALLASLDGKGEGE